MFLQLVAYRVCISFSYLDKTVVIVIDRDRVLRFAADFFGFDILWEQIENQLTLIASRKSFVYSELLRFS